MMGFAVIAKIEAHDLEPTLEQLLRKRQDVERVRTPLPTMQDHNRLAVTVGGTGNKRLQTDIVAAIEQQLLLCTEQRRAPLLYAAPTRHSARQNRLHMAITEPAGRPEVFVRSKRHGGKC